MCISMYYGGSGRERVGCFKISTSEYFGKDEGEVCYAEMTEPDRGSRMLTV